MKPTVITLLGTKYELGPHPDGRPGFEAFPVQVWAWPGILVGPRGADRN